MQNYNENQNITRSKASLTIPSTNPNRKNLPDNLKELDPKISAKPKLNIRMKTEGNANANNLITNENYGWNSTAQYNITQPSPHNILVRKGQPNGNIQRPNDQPKSAERINTNYSPIQHPSISPYSDNMKSANRSYSKTPNIKRSSIESEDLLSVIKRLANEKVDIENECLSLRKENFALISQLQFLQQNQTQSMQQRYEIINRENDNNDFEKLRLENEALVNIVKSHGILIEQRDHWMSKVNELTGRLNQAEEEIIRLHGFSDSNKINSSFQYDNSALLKNEEIQKREFEISRLRNELQKSQNQIKSLETEFMPHYTRLVEENRELRSSPIKSYPQNNEFDEIRITNVHLMNDVAVYEEKIRRLEADYQELERKFREIENSHFGNVKEDYPGELYSLRSQYRECLQELEATRNLQNENYSDKNALNGLQRENDYQRSEINRLNIEIEGLTSDNQRMAMEISEIMRKTQGFDEYKIENENLRNQLYSLKQETVRLIQEQEANNDTRDYDSLLATVVLLKASLESLSWNYDELLKSITEERIGFNRQLEDLRSENYTLSEEIRIQFSKVRENQDSLNEINRLKDSLREKDNELYNLQSLVTTLRTQISNHSSSSESRNQEINKIRITLEKISQNLLNSNFKFDDRQSLEFIIKELEDKIYQLKKNLEFKDKEFQEYINYLNSKSDLRSSMSYNQTNSGVTYELEILQKEKIDLLREIENMRNRYSNLAIQCEEYKNKITILNQNLIFANSNQSNTQNFEREIEFLKRGLDSRFHCPSHN